MAGTYAGGRKAAQTNKEKHDQEYMEKYGMGFYQYLGSQGGKKSRGGGFTDRALARRAGKIGGSKSRRGPNRAVKMTPVYYDEVVQDPPITVITSVKKHWWSR